MWNILDASKHILDARGPMTMSELRTLCCFAAWAMVRDDGELFPEDFEAF